jgi:hypothetical protein
VYATNGTDWSNSVTSHEARASRRLSRQRYRRPQTNTPANKPSSSFGLRGELKLVGSRDVPHQTVPGAVLSIQDRVCRSEARRVGRHARVVPGARRGGAAPSAKSPVLLMNAASGPAKQSRKPATGTTLDPTSAGRCHDEDARRDGRLALPRRSTTLSGCRYSRFTIGANIMPTEYTFALDEAVRRA